MHGLGIRSVDGKDHIFKAFGAVYIGLQPFRRNVIRRGALGIGGCRGVGVDVIAPALSQAGFELPGAAICGGW